ncbi:restriction endonuclease subunit S [Thermomonas sp. LB-4]|uniref:restriction endonuclease subunit S n=1 Tax=Thermomonas sp. LB-4 TaxID=3102790 RepID=UPI002ED8CA77
MTSRFIALEDIADISAGNPAPQDAADFSEDGQPFVRMQDVGREHHTRTLTHTADKLTADAVRRNRLRLYPAGTLLIPKSGASINLNHRALLARDAYVVSHLATVVPDTSRVDADYLYFWSLTYDPRSQAQTTSLPSLPTSLIKSARIPLPPLSEQRRVVDLLSRAEGIVRLRREAQRKAAELVPALFLEMFGDPASNPKGWQMYRIDELLERFEGGKNLQAGDDESATYRILKISAVTSGRYIESESKPAPNDLIPAQSHFVRTGDLLISRANTEALVGATAIVDRTDGRTLLPDKLWRFVWRSDTAIEPKFALHLFQQPAIRNKLSQLASGTGGSMKNISQAKLKTLELPVPPIELQRQFAAKADAVRGIAAQQAAALATAQATFDALLHQSFAVS